MSCCLDWCKYYSPFAESYDLPQTSCCYCCGCCCCEGSGEIKRTPINSGLSGKIYAPLPGENNKNDASFVKSGNHFLHRSNDYCHGEGAFCCNGAPGRQVMVSHKKGKSLQVFQNSLNPSGAANKNPSIGELVSHYQQVVDEEF